MKSLEKDSKVLKSISTNFRNQASKFKIVSFIEQKTTPPLKERVSHSRFDSYSFSVSNLARLLMMSAVSWTFQGRLLCLWMAAITGRYADSVTTTALLSNPYLTRLACLFVVSPYSSLYMFMFAILWFFLLLPLH